MGDRIFQHEHWQHVGLRQFIQGYWTRRGWGVVPDTGDVQGVVAAEVNQGRWVAECPAKCGGAVCASRAEPRFLCPNCGSPENGGRWYAVAFPPDADAIEAVLLRRPERDGWQAASRNWKPGESLRKLKTENLVRGIIETL